MEEFEDLSERVKNDLNSVSDVRKEDSKWIFRGEDVYNTETGKVKELYGGTPGIISVGMPFPFPGAVSR